MNNIDIQFNNISYSVSGKYILNGVSGHFKYGELTAIMGPSGSGKTTLINILTGFIRSGVNGKINQINMNDTKNHTYRKRCCYVQQDDHLYDTFSIEETLNLVSNLKLGNISAEEKKTSINDILGILNLNHAKHTKCGRLSGGERKRTSIAMELIDNPLIMFLDEPTTGLDDSSARQCIQLLHQLCRKSGCTIICTIHQPTAFVYEIFDYIYVIANGLCVYQGLPENTVAYLSDNGMECPPYHSSADFLLDVVSGEYGSIILDLVNSAIDDKWRLSNVNNTTLSSNYRSDSSLQLEDMNTEQNHQFKYGNFKRQTEIIRPNEFQIFLHLLHRCIIHFHRDWTVSYLKLFMHIVIAILIGILFGHDAGYNASKAIANVAFLLSGIMYLWYTSLMSNVIKYPAEVHIIKKETFNHWYKLRTYYVAHMVISTPTQIILSIIFTFIVMFLTNQPINISRFGQLTLVYSINCLLAEGLGLCIGSVMMPLNGLFVGMFFSAFTLAFCGFLAVSNHIIGPIIYLLDISPMRYTLEALFLAVYENNHLVNMICQSDYFFCYIRNTKVLFNELAMRSGMFWPNILVLTIITILLRFSAYFLLKLRIKYLLH